MTLPQGNPKMLGLDTGYTAEVDSIDKQSWHELFCGFADASFYQTWSYGAVRWHERNLSHLVLKKRGQIVAIAQLRLVSFPLMKSGIAYLHSGPMWKPAGEETNFEHLANMLRALSDEYVRHRGFLLRIRPKVVDKEGRLRNLFLAEGYTWRQDPQKTVIVDLSLALDEIKNNLRRGWKRSLKAAETNSMVFMQSTDDTIIDMAMNLVREMKKRKKFIEFKDMEEIMAVHRDLPQYLKFQIIVCKYNESPVSVLGWFPAGKIGLPLLGATGNNGVPLKASFPLWWKMIEFYKEKDFYGCDLAGVNKERNPGGYLFKTGLAGKHAQEVGYVGQFDACENLLVSLVFRIAFFIRESYRRFLFKVNQSIRTIRCLFRPQSSDLA